jgi:hypothetical protein
MSTATTIENPKAPLADATCSAANPKEYEILHEEIVTHPTAEHKTNGWRGEARIMGLVKIRGRTYEFDQVVSLRFHDPEDD